MSLLWKSSTGTRLSVLSSIDGRVFFDFTKHITSNTSDNAPAVTGSSNDLLIAWTATNDAKNLCIDDYSDIFGAPPPAPGDIPITRKWHADVTFSDSTPLGGWVDFVADNTGAFTFSGHMYDSGFDPISFTIAVAIITPTGMAYGFGFSGRCAGHDPLSSGDENSNWMGTQTSTWKDQNGNIVPNPNPAIAAHWSEIVQGQMLWNITAQDLTAQGIVDFVTQQVLELAKQAAQAGVTALIALL